MNSKLLIQKKINIQPQYIEFLNFIHPDYEIITDIDEYDNPFPIGIIYTGKYVDGITEKLNSITPNWIIVSNSHYECDLSTKQGLLKYLLPLYYYRLEKEKNHVYDSVSYDTLIEKIKVSLITNSNLRFDEEDSNSVYPLFAAILGTPNILNEVFFTTVCKENVGYITSSILTFLNNVITQNVRGMSPHYANLIIQSNRRYGKRIKSAISKFVKSSANKEMSLYKLLTDLNRAK